MNKRIVGSIREVDPSTTEASEGLKLYHPWMKDDTSIPPYIRILNKSVEYDPRHSQWDELEVWANHFFHNAFPLLDFEQCRDNWDRRQKVVGWIQKETNKNWWKRLHCRLWGHDEKIYTDKFKWKCKRCGATDELIYPVLSGRWYYPTYHILRFIRGYPLSAYCEINVLLHCFAGSTIYKLPERVKPSFAHAIAALLLFTSACFYYEYRYFDDPIEQIYKKAAQSFLENGTKEHWEEMVANSEKYL